MRGYTGYILRDEMDNKNQGVKGIKICPDLIGALKTYKLPRPNRGSKDIYLDLYNSI